MTTVASQEEEEEEKKKKKDEEALDTNVSIYMCNSRCHIFHLGIYTYTNSYQRIVFCTLEAHKTLTVSGTVLGSGDSSMV